ncbi:MAG: TetR/AcrR family transcriptional regulator [Actinomycetota bacterium]|nr:TetR/AcrR family transcriptional regulator [Actinomycetota bacterium]
MAGTHRDNPWIADLEWVRPAPQDRGRRTQFRLLDALERLLDTEHIDDVSVAAIVSEASSSVGAFYHHFTDRQTLVYAMLERVSNEFEATTRAAVAPERWQHGGIEDILRGYLEFALDVGRTRPGLRRAEAVLALRDPEVRAMLDKQRRLLADGVGDLLRARVGEIGHPDPLLAIDYVVAQTAAVLDARLDAHQPGALLADHDDAVFIAETLRSIRAYLDLRPAPTPD